MKHLSRVVWSEGMYLGPHHFQAQNRFFEDSVHFSTSNLLYSPFGFSGLDLDVEALRNGRLQLVHARGLMPDGTPFHLPEFDAAPPERYVRDLFAPLAEHILVYLAIPRRKPDGLNCALDPLEDHQGIRYLKTDVKLTDENTGRDEKEITLGQKNLRFVVSGEDTEGFETIPMARVKRDGSGRFILDPNYVPPCLEIGAAPMLMLMVHRLVDLIEDKCEKTARPKDLGNPTASGYSAEGIANAWFLHCLNSSLAPLRHLASKRPHPEELYVEMSRLAGALCTFSLDSHPSQLPLYDHMRLEETFGQLDHHIRTHLELLVPTNRVEIELEREARYFWAGMVKDQRTLNRSRWVLGIYSNLGESELIERTPRLVKLCSKAFVPRLVERALPGLTLKHLSVPPPAVSPRVDFQYFSVDKSGPCWEHLVKTREVGLYIPGEIPDPQIELSVILES